MTAETPVLVLCDHVTCNEGVWLNYHGWGRTPEGQRSHDYRLRLATSYSVCITCAVFFFPYYIDRLLFDIASDQKSTSE